MFFQETLISLRDLLTPNVADNLFLTQFKTLSITEKINKIEDLIKQNQFDFIVKLGCIDKEFRETCLRSQLSPNWLSLWSTYGIIITNDPRSAFFAQPAQHEFDLFLGIYFYHKAVSYAASIKESDSQTEHTYLQEAIKYGSIHALQRYSHSVYTRIEANQLDAQTAGKLIQDIIKNIKDLLPYYTSYAHLMLAEAYVRYGFLKPEQAKQAEKSALTACTHAKRLYRAGDHAIFNASFSHTLADSNSMRFETPEAAIIGIKSLFKNRESQASIATAPGTDSVNYRSGSH